MDRSLLDTDTLSEILKGRDLNVALRADRYLDRHPRLTFSSVTTMEILYGLGR